MKNNALIIWLFLGLLTAGVCYADEGDGNNDPRETLVSQETATVQEAPGLRGAKYTKLDLSCVLFLNFTHYESYWDPSAMPTKVSNVGLNLERASLTAEYKFDSTYKMQVTLDTNISYNPTTGVYYNELFLKNASVSGNYLPELTVEVGIIDTPWIVYEESLWKHRYVTKIQTDTSFDSSDGGIGARGNFFNGLVNYHLAVVNGGGYKNMAFESKTVDIDSRLGFNPFKDLTVDLQFRDGFKGSRTEQTDGARTTLCQAMVTYGLDNFRVGANYFLKKIDDKSNHWYRKNNGFALWAWGDIYIGLGIFGRYEYEESPAVSSAPSGMPDARENHYVIGIEYEAIDNISVALAWDYSKTKNISNLSGITQKQEYYGLYLQTEF